jgi:hypothetical protein
MANAESTALRESEPVTTTTRSTILWEIEPRLRVTPSDSLSSLNELIVRPHPFSSFSVLLLLHFIYDILPFLAVIFHS